MKSIIISMKSDKHLRAIQNLMISLIDLGLNNFVIPLKNKKITTARQLIKTNKDALLIIKEVSDSTYGEYLYSYSQIASSRENYLIILYDILIEYLEDINLKKIIIDLLKANTDIIVAKKIDSKEHINDVKKYRIYLNKDNTLKKITRMVGHDYEFVGILRIRSKFFEWLKRKYGTDPNLINKELDDIINEYIFNGNKIYVLVI